MVHMPHIENYLKAIIIANLNSTTQEHILDELQVVTTLLKSYFTLQWKVQHFTGNFSIIYCTLISFTGTGAIHASENTTIYEEFNGTVQCLSNRIELEGMREFVRALVSLH